MICKYGRSSANAVELYARARFPIIIRIIISNQPVPVTRERERETTSKDRCMDGN